MILFRKSTFWPRVEDCSFMTTLKYELLNQYKNHMLFRTCLYMSKLQGEQVLITIRLHEGCYIAYTCNWFSKDFITVNLVALILICNLIKTWFQRKGFYCKDIFLVGICRCSGQIREDLNTFWSLSAQCPMLCSAWHMLRERPRDRMICTYSNYKPKALAPQR